jgi:uncharacterized protein YndB with AHSA1/START domain
MIVRILVGIVVVVGAFLAYVAMRPADLRVTRSIVIAAPPQAVFAHVNDFKKWQTWSPWEKIDPAMKRGYEGAPSGTGAVYTWAGNNEVGSGRMAITESKPGELIRVRLEFEKPFRATNQAEFAFKVDGDRTTVTWTLTGENNFISKAITLFMDMDRMIGGMYEKGLAQLKTLSEAKP